MTDKPPPRRRPRAGCVEKGSRPDVWAIRREAIAHAVGEIDKVLDTLKPGEGFILTVWVEAVSPPRSPAWRKAVLERDGHRCQECGTTEDLHAHHVLPVIDRPDLVDDVDNGRTLCQPCHVETHRRMRCPA